MSRIGDAATQMHARCFRNLTQVALIRHGAGAPVRRIGGRRFQRQRHHALDVRIRNRPRRSRPRFVEQAVDPLVHETPAPFTGH
jgi:hypothetical protein